MNLKDIYLDNEFEDVSGIEILNTHWNTKNIKFSAEMFDEFIRNFEKYKSEKQPHVKIDHTNQQAILKALTGEQFEEGTELPNLGFIEKMYHNGQSLFADIVGVPKKLKDIIFGGKLFKAVSPEATWNFRGTGEKLITALAMTNNPSQKHILDVHMDESTADVCASGARNDSVICFSGDISIYNEGGHIMSDTTKTTDEKNTQASFSDEAVESFAEKITARLSGLFGKKEEVSVSQKMDEPVIALAEYQKMEGQFKTLLSEVNGLKLSLMEKEKAQLQLNEQVAAIQLSTREEKAEAICKKAVMDGIPPVVVNHFKPILLSEQGEKTIKLSEKIGDKIVEAEKPMVEIIKDFFKIYPDKVDFSDRSHTRLEEPGSDEEAKLSEIDKRKTEYMKAGMPEHEALEKAGLEVYSKKGGN